jgi:hypothetical protein
MVDDKNSSAAYVLLLIAGIFILLGAGLISSVGLGFIGAANRFGEREVGMMGRGFGMMGYRFAVLGIIGL